VSNKSNIIAECLLLLQGRRGEGNKAYTVKVSYSLILGCYLCHRGARGSVMVKALC
jgi:hypothetical protein